MKGIFSKEECFYRINSFTGKINPENNKSFSVFVDKDKAIEFDLVENCFYELTGKIEDRENSSFATSNILDLNDLKKPNKKTEE